MLKLLWDAFVMISYWDSLKFMTLNNYLLVAFDLVRSWCGYLVDDLALLLGSHGICVGCFGVCVRFFVFMSLLLTTVNMLVMLLMLDVCRREVLIHIDFWCGCLVACVVMVHYSARHFCVGYGDVTYDVVHLNVRRISLVIVLLMFTVCIVDAVMIVMLFMVVSYVN
eukprot:gene2813-1798_t